MLVMRYVISSYDICDVSYEPKSVGYEICGVCYCIGVHTLQILFDTHCNEHVLGLYPEPGHAHAHRAGGYDQNGMVTSQKKPEHHGCILYKCCFFNLDDNSAKDGCYSFTIRPEKPRTFKMLEPSKPPHAKKSRKERNLGRLADATGSTKIMEHQIWKEFPEDLYEAVIACKTSHCHFLPLPLCL
ncbi:hypothetical protein TEA_005939 [Camellia sinensis var. sinensis]|uniref:Uncharacterized protein n=1 Tax=Camellia sinensis var. sinensis TaxID=542762 RepID=A0A4S4EET7_CAMSN|nr:hypothetical protein TEA_005939 [Camellia sinensis var. sinensis]